MVARIDDAMVLRKIKKLESDLYIEKNDPTIEYITGLYNSSPISSETMKFVHYDVEKISIIKKLNEKLIVLIGAIIGLAVGMATTVTISSYLRYRKINN